jgi:HrpA-like RNA helicase
MRHIALNGFNRAEKLYKSAIKEVPSSHANYAVQLMFREAYRLVHPLPALLARDSVTDALRRGPCRFILIRGETGSGKSTQLPQYIADMEEFRSRTIICTQPRHGRQMPEVQEKVFLPAPKNMRKVIFSTDVAETSITIDGLVHVIDMGMCKIRDTGKINYTKVCPML